MTAIRHRTAPLVVKPRRVSPAHRGVAPSRPAMAEQVASIHRSVFWGVVWMVLAGLATGITSLALEGSAGPEAYVFWWGPLAYGASMVVVGLRDLRTIRDGEVPERFLP